MDFPSAFDRLRSWLRQIFFWLPSSTEEERPADIGHDHALVASLVSTERVPRWRQLRYISRILSFNERRLLFLSFWILVLSLGGTTAYFVYARTVTVPAVGGTYTEALIGQPKYLNPLDAIANDVDRDVVQLVYSGLFKFHGLDVIPDVAESYNWSADNRTLTIKLRNDVRFHDGTPLTSEDVQFTFDAIAEPTRRSPLAPLYRGVQVHTQDDTTVAFELEKPDVQFLSKLTVGILPAHLWQDVSPSNARLSVLNVKPIGSGPYHVKSFLRDSTGNLRSYNLERFDQYYGIKPYIKNVVFQFFPSRQEALDAFKSELVDGLAFLNGSEAEKYTTSGRREDLELELPEESALFFNVKDKTLSNKDVRLALSLAIDREELKNTLKGSDVITGPYPFAAVATSTQDMDRARQLLENAGWVLPQNSNVRIWSPKKTAPKIVTPPKGKTTTTTSTSPEPTLSDASSTELSLTINVPEDADLIALAEAVQRQWSLLGAHVTIEAIPTEELVKKATREHSSQVVLIDLLLSTDQNLFPFWWSGQSVERGLNFSNISDRGIDDALEKVRNATTSEAMAVAQQEASNAILTTNAAIFLLRPAHHYLLSSRVKGVSDKQILGQPADRFQDLERWYIKQGWRWK
jgi:peptide/nickel transport system substrate-binding protein